MIIKSLKLHNIRSYLSQEIELPRGTVLLSGDVGSGKSTILLAIEFALFGISKGMLSGEALLRHGKQSGYVELAFSFDGREVLIKRSLKRLKDSVRQDEGYLIVDGVKHFCTAEELRARVLDMMGYPKELLKKSKGMIYRFTVYTPQEDMKLILFEDPQLRLDTLRRVFQVDKYKLVREGAVIVLQALREKRKELAARVEDLPFKQEQLAKVLSDVALAEEKLAALAPAIANAEALLAKKHDSLKALEEKARQLSQLRSQLAAVNAVTADKRKLVISKEAEIALALEEIAALKSGLAGNEDASKLSTALSRLKSFSDSLLKDAERKKSLEDGLLLAEQLRLEVESGISRDEALKSSSQQLRQKISSLGQCPTCLQPVPQEHKHKISAGEDARLSELAQSLAAASEKKMSLMQRIKDFRSGLADIQSKEKVAASLVSELKQYFELAASLGVEVPAAQQHKLSVVEMQAGLAELSAAKKSIELSRQRLLVLSEKERAMESAKSFIDACNREIKSLDAGKAELSASVSSFGDVDAEISLLQSEFNAVSKERTALLMQKAAFDKEAESLGVVRQSLLDEISRKEAARREMEAAANLSYWLEEMFVSLVGVIERHVMMKVHREFNDLFTDWFSMLMGNEALSARLDEEFTPLVEAEGFEIPIENLSGGEKTSCALAYRLALNMVINRLVSAIRTKDILILDEPTDGFSSEQLDKLRDVLLRLQLPQVIIVSHEDRIESFVQSVIRIQKEQHVSRVAGVN